MTRESHTPTRRRTEVASLSAPVRIERARRPRRRAARPHRFHDRIARRRADWSPDDARAEALRRFGNVSRTFASTVEQLDRRHHAAQDAHGVDRVLLLRSPPRRARTPPRAGLHVRRGVVHRARRRREHDGVLARQRRRCCDPSPARTPTGSSASIAIITVRSTGARSRGSANTRSRSSTSSASARPR